MSFSLLQSFLEDADDNGPRVLVQPYEPPPLRSGVPEPLSFEPPKPGIQDQPLHPVPQQGRTFFFTPNPLRSVVIAQQPFCSIEVWASWS